MNNSQSMYVEIAEGKLAGFPGVPKHIVTVISNVFIFDNGQVLKIYKRDNEWWNKDMNDLSAGASRIDFITNDFAFNNALNPGVYRDLKVLARDKADLVLRDPSDTDDELVIVMNTINTDATLTNTLSNASLTLSEYEKIGREFVEKKQLLSKEFLPQNMKPTWYELLADRFIDLEGWVRSAEEFPKDLADEALLKLTTILEAQKEKFSTTSTRDLSVCIDCNSENLLVIDGALVFIDAYPPKNEWRIGAFEMDIFRVGSDIYAMAGKDAYETYLKGAYSVTKDMISSELETFYLLYGAMIVGPYFYMLAQKDISNRVRGDRYTEFIRYLLSAI